MSARSESDGREGLAARGRWLMAELVPAGAMALFALASGYATLTVYRDQEAIAETETSTTASLTPGPVKLKGRVEALETVISPIDGSEAVMVDWKVTGEENDFDEENNNTRDQLAGGLRTGEFALADQHGQVRIDPPYGAELAASDENTLVDNRYDPSLDTLETVDERARDGDDEGTRGSVQIGTTHDEYDSTTFRHEVLRPGDDLLVVGSAQQTDDGWVVGEGEGEFLLSDMSEDELTWEIKKKLFAVGAVTVVCAAAAVYFVALA